VFGLLGVLRIETFAFQYRKRCPMQSVFLLTLPFLVTCFSPYDFQAVARHLTRAGEASMLRVAGCATPSPKEQRVHLAFC